MVEPMPATLNVRVTMASGRIVGLDWIDDGFAPTVPCTHDGCYKAAKVIAYEIGTDGRLYRFCEDHVPMSVLKYVVDVLKGIRELSDEPKRD